MASSCCCCCCWCRAIAAVVGNMIEQRLANARWFAPPRRKLLAGSWWCSSEQRRMRVWSLLPSRQWRELQETTRSSFSLPLNRCWNVFAENSLKRLHLMDSSSPRLTCAPSSSAHGTFAIVSPLRCSRVLCDGLMACRLCAVVEARRSTILVHHGCFEKRGAGATSVLVVSKI